MGERKLSFKPIDLREADFKRAVNAFVKYAPDMRLEFIEYWTEPDRAANPRMKFEKEKTWDTGRRLARWDRSPFNKGKDQAPVVHMMQPKKEPMAQELNDIDRLDALLAKYSLRPTAYTIEGLAKNWPLEALTNCYKAIREYKLWDPTITKKDLEGLEERKLKATVIVRTLDYYGVRGWTFSDTIKTRNGKQR